MRWIIPLYIIVSVLVGLSLYDWFRVDDSPNLNEEHVNDLLTTHLTQIGVKGATRTCAKEMFNNVVLALENENVEEPDIEYVGNDLWVISNGLCSYTVSDKTGKVLGP